MLRSIIIWFSLVAALALFVSGCGPHWTVVKQASPNPLVGQQQFALEPTSFEGLMVQDKTEADFKSSRDAKAN